MQYIATIFLGILLISCNATKVIAQDNIQSATYQSWVAGVRGGGGGIIFNLKLNSEFPKEVVLKRLIFKGYEVSFNEINPVTYQAAINTGVNQESVNSSNNSVSSSKNSTKLKDNEAILIFLKDGKEIQQKISNVEKMPSLEYPSAKPKF